MTSTAPPSSSRRLPLADDIPVRDRGLVWATAFRPFFPLAALAAVTTMVSWAGHLAGLWSLERSVPAHVVHGHEMISGVVGAVLAGFLLTAARVWTRLPTAAGPLLAGLCGLWACARIASLAGVLAVEGLASAIFFAGVAATLLVPIVRARSTRNLVFPLWLLALAGLEIVHHLTLDQGLWWFTVPAGLHLTAGILVTFAPRVIPMFTRNRIGEDKVRPRDLRDPVGTACFLIALMAFACQLPAPIQGAAWIVSGAANLFRSIGWGGRLTTREPLLLVLHMGWWNLHAGYLLFGLSAITGLPGAVGFHLTCVGGVGVLLIGMTQRVTLGHTGRPLVSTRGMRWALSLIYGSVFLRILAPLLPAAGVRHGWLGASALWIVCWSLVLATLAPMCRAPRADGRPG